MSMSHMKNLLILNLIIFAAGCTTIRNVSENPSFRGEVGLKHLVKNVFICAIHDKAIFETKLPSNELYENHGFQSCPYGTDVASLSIGKEIEISEVSHRSHFGIVSYTDHWYLIGSAEVNGNALKFYYYLGLTTDGKPPADYKSMLLWK